jgi:hypothetical protein
VNEHALNEVELEAVVRFLDDQGAPHPYTVTDGPPLATGAEKLRRELTYRINQRGAADEAGVEPGLAPPSATD